MAKCRGKSMLNDETAEAATTNIATAANAATATATQTYLPQTSLLKIEPFVPSFNQRLRRRPIGRSYSTLSHNAIPKRSAASSRMPQQQATAVAPAQQQQPVDLALGSLLDCAPTYQQQQLKRTYAAAAQLRAQRLPARSRGIITRQRSKSTSSSAASNSCRPVTAAALATPTTCVGSTGGTLVSGAIVTPQPNGICRIQRLPKEREELPDRINYDRRGLTAIPIFEQEPTLRLLSLQHNLINIFHIPKEQPEPEPAPAPVPTAAPTPSPVRDNHNNGKTAAEAVEQLQHHRHAGLRGHLRRATTNANKASSPNASSPLTTQAMAIGSAGAGGKAKLLQRHSQLQRAGQAQLTPPPAPATQQQQLRRRNGLERARSFMASCGPAGASSGRALQALKPQQQLMQQRALLRAQCKLQSCDESQASGSVYNELGGEEEEPSICSNGNGLLSQLEQLSIKNKQLSLSASYGSIFQQLVFLDLYDNQIERVANLDGLPVLSVLLLGKNRITDIAGLSSLRGTLRVLDLHGNKLSSISNRINCLQQLRSLNLAGNQLRQINQQDFNGLRCLKELNLKRNKLKRINGFQHLVSLERLWLCHNELHKVDDMASIARASKLLEVTIENNPVSLAGDCVSFLVSYLPLLQTLSQMPITEQVRRAALNWRQHKEQAQATHGASENYQSIRREEVISNARTNWELLRSQQTVQNTLLRASGAAAARPTKKHTSELTKINESNETPAGHSDEQSCELEQLQALTKLPPIAKKQDEEASSEASSLGPNVDSCSSCYSSDNEELSNCSSKQQASKPAQTDENSNKVQATLQPPATTPSPPALTLTPPAAEQQPQPGKPVVVTPPPAAALTLPLPAAQAAGRPASSRQRSRTPTTQLVLHTQNVRHAQPAKRYMPGSLVRSQTVVGAGGGSSNSSSSNSGRTAGKPATTNVVSLVAPQTASSSAAAAKSVAIPVNSNGSCSTPTAGNAAAAMTVCKTNAAEREREQGGDFLIEICGRYLNVYGQGALRFIDKQWNPAKANDVHTLNFSYINFNNIVPLLGRVKLRFPHAEHYVFRETNISCLGQLNALAELQGISSLMIDGEGNGVIGKQLWRSYAIYRLSHWGLKQLNGQQVSEAEVDAANAMYAGLSELVLWSMPDVMLQPLLARLRLDETCTASKLSPKEWLMRPDNKSLRLVVGKEALQWKKTTVSSQPCSATADAVGCGSALLAPSAPQSARDRGRQHFSLLMENTCNAVEKLHKLETLWPSMLLDIVRNTLLDYAQLEVYLRNLMCELMK